MQLYVSASGQDVRIHIQSNAFYKIRRHRGSQCPQLLSVLHVYPVLEATIISRCDQLQRHEDEVQAPRAIQLGGAVDGIELRYAAIYGCVHAHATRSYVSQSERVKAALELILSPHACRSIN